MANPSGFSTEEGWSMHVEDQNGTLIGQGSLAFAKLRRQATADAAFLRSLSTKTETTDKISEFAYNRSRSVGYHRDHALHRQMYLRMYSPFVPVKGKESMKEKTKKWLKILSLKKNHKKPKAADDTESHSKQNSATGESSIGSQPRLPLVVGVRRFFGCRGANLDVLDFSFRKNSAINPLS